MGRVGPNCEFAACPAPKPSPTSLLPMVTKNNEYLTPELDKQIQPLEETANWKIYLNEKQGYSIKYPPGWNIVNDSLFDGNIIGGIKSPQQSDNPSQLKIEVHSGDLSYERYAYFYHLSPKGSPKNLGKVNINTFVWEKFSNNDDLSENNNLYVLGTTNNSKKYFLVKQVNLQSNNAAEDSRLIEQMIQTFSLFYNK